MLKGKLKHVAAQLARLGGEQVKVFVDTAPVMEKPLAAAAGLGWQGKHSVLVSRDHGSWLFLGAIFTTAELPADEPAQDHCGSCRRCLDICPTDAFPAPYQLDSRRCIAYLTIEHKGPIPRDLRQGIGNRVFGCDDCLAVCPWNKFAAAARETKLRARDDLGAIPLAELAQLDDAGFRALFAGTPDQAHGARPFRPQCHDRYRQFRRRRSRFRTPRRLLRDPSAAGPGRGRVGAVAPAARGGILARASRAVAPEGMRPTPTSSFRMGERRP